ncbi:hypothetical protein KQI86_09140 [Clostridium sp. MSJ-11]|uniref:Lipoprotein n=1 Tax=Clostridium mobile TaxID=2841512 RepID=A0ABS6EH04_9CLOT|nr:hypothetical protein [Clostridium mobile]MBU5484493.1 hypothetical protein [Clostridium mobile]
MKKINKVLSSLILCFAIITIVSGCGKSNLKDREVEKLQSNLITIAEENSGKYFGKKLNTKDFDISFAREVKEDEYEDIKSLDGVKNVYMIGHFNGKPSDIIEFNLIYDVESKKIVKFGLKTLKDDHIVYANLKE